MSSKETEPDFWKKFNLWVPRILIGFSILLFVYFTQRTYRFRGYWDETFLAEDNLQLIRGPFAKKMYYERGLLDYEPKELFPEEDYPTPATSPIEIIEKRVEDSLTREGTE